MKMAKTALAVSLLAALAQPALAADLTVYGKANVTVQSSDDGEGGFTEIKSNASRFGVKGGQKLDAGLSVVYKMEWQVDMSDKDKSSDDHLKARNQYVGLKGDFGQVLIGRNDTALKQSQGKIDLFNDLEADIKHLWKAGGNGENRMGDSLTFKSKKFNGFQFIGTMIAEDEKDADNGYSAAVTYGDKKLKKSQFFASIAADSDVKGYDIMRATVQGKLGDFKLGAMYQTQETTGPIQHESDGFLVNAAYKMDKTTFKVQYQSIDFDGAKASVADISEEVSQNFDSRNVLSLGVDYKLAKNTKLFGFYTTFDNDSKADTDYLGLGMEYKF